MITQYGSRATLTSSACELPYLLQHTGAKEVNSV